jgi:hypothetical protein
MLQGGVRQVDKHLLSAFVRWESFAMRVGDLEARDTDTVLPFSAGDSR